MDLCKAAFGGLWTFEGDHYVAVALRNVPQAYASFLSKETRISGPGTAPYRLLHGEPLVHNIDLASEEPYRSGDPGRRALVDLGGARTALQVPLRKEDFFTGVITLSRQEVRPFTDEGIDLVQNFAAQAVIAIENTRLLKELRKSLQQQTATADVLKVDQPLDIRSTERARYVDRVGRPTVPRGTIGNAAAERRSLPSCCQLQATSPNTRSAWNGNRSRPGRRLSPARVALEGKSIHVIDALLDPSPEVVNRARTGNSTHCARCTVIAPRNAHWRFAFTAQHCTAVTDKEIALAETFADQAVIAIENVRLFEAEQQRARELSESLQQQTATSEVLKVISSSPGDLQPVFDAMLANASRICDAYFGNIYRWDGDAHASSCRHTTRRPPFAEARRRSAVSTRPRKVRQIGRYGSHQAAQAVDRAADESMAPMSTISPLYQIMAGTRSAHYPTTTAVDTRAAYARSWAFRC